MLSTTRRTNLSAAETDSSTIIRRTCASAKMEIHQLLLAIVLLAKNGRTPSLSATKLSAAELTSSSMLVTTTACVLMDLTTQSAPSPAEIMKFTSSIIPDLLPVNASQCVKMATFSTRKRKPAPAPMVAQSSKATPADAHQSPSNAKSSSFLGTRLWEQSAATKKLTTTVNSTSASATTARAPMHEDSVASHARRSSSTHRIHQLASLLVFALRLFNSRTRMESAWRTPAKSHSTRSSSQTAQLLAAQRNHTLTLRNVHASACPPNSRQMTTMNVRKNVQRIPFQSLTLKLENSTASLLTALQDSTLPTPKSAAETI